MAEFNAEQFEKSLKSAKEKSDINKRFEEFKADLDKWKEDELKEPDADKNAIREDYKRILEEFKIKKAEIINTSHNEKRKLRYKFAREYGWNITDPDKEGAKIDDYEGLGDNNRYGFGRTVLAGYLVGLQFNDPALATKVFEEAKSVFSKKTFTDLTDDDVKEIVKSAYFDQVNHLNITNETKGLLAAYLRLADSLPENQKQVYKNYLFGNVSDLHYQVDAAKSAVKSTLIGTGVGAALGTGVSGPLGTVVGTVVGAAAGLYASGRSAESYKKENEQAKLELDRFEKLLSPKEWAKLQDKYKDDENETDESSPNIKEKKSETGATALRGKRKEFNEQIEDFKKRAGNLDQKNRDALADQLKDAEKAVSDFADHINNNKFDAQALELRDKTESLLNASLGTLTAMESAEAAVKAVKGPGGEVPEPGKEPPPEGADPYKKEWPNGEAVDNPFAGYNGRLIVKPGLDHNANLRDNEGNIPAALLPGTAVMMENPKEKGKKVRGDVFVKIKFEGTEYYVHENDFEIKESDQEMNKFLDEKKLTEVKRGDGKYVYSVQDFGYKMENGEFVVQFSNPDVQSTFGENAKNYLDKIFADKALSEGEEDKIRKDAKEHADDEISEKALFNELMLGTLVKKLNPQEKKNWDAINKIMYLARQDSTLTFASRPGRAELEKAYNEDFLPPWKRAVKKLDRYVQEEEKAKEKAATQEVIPGLEALGKVNSEYREAFKRIQEDKDKPGGALFYLPFNKTNLECSLKKDGKEYVLSYRNLRGQEKMAFESAEKAMEAINNGEVFRRMAWDMLHDKYYYQRYESKIGDMQDLKVVAAEGAKGYMVKMQLDWKGPTFLGGGNAEIWAEALPHGQISYRVNRDNVGVVGESIMEGKSANFDDFMRHVAHIKTWAENYDKDKVTDVVARKEKLFREITNPESYREKEKEMGRYISFDTLDDNVVQLYLDWGKGSAKDPNVNPMFNIWVNAEGALKYIVNFSGKNFLREGRAASFKDLTEQVSKVREEVRTLPEKSADAPS